MRTERRRFPWLSTPDVKMAALLCTQHTARTLQLWSYIHKLRCNRRSSTSCPPAQMQQTLGITQQPPSSGTWVQQPRHPNPKPWTLDHTNAFAFSNLWQQRAVHMPRSTLTHIHHGLPSDSGQIRLRHQRAVYKLKHQLPPVSRSLCHRDAHGRLVEDRESYRAIPRRHGLLLLIQHILRARAGFAAGADAGCLQRRGRAGGGRCGVCGLVCQVDGPLYAVLGHEDNEPVGADLLDAKRSVQFDPLPRVSIYKPPRAALPYQKNL